MLKGEFTVRELLSKIADNYVELAINEYDGKEHTGRRYIIEKHFSKVNDIPDEILDALVSQIIPYFDRISIEVEKVTANGVEENPSPVPAELIKPIVETLSITDFSVGDKVAFATSNPYSLRMHRLPGYLLDGELTVVGFTPSKVKCDWDGGKPFNIPPEMLKKVY